MKNYNDSDELITKTIAVIISIVLLIGYCVFVGKVNRSSNDSSNDIKWNNGVCQKDNTSWKYSNSAHSRYWRYDYYVCEDGHVIELVNDYETR